MIKFEGEKFNNPKAKPENFGKGGGIHRKTNKNHNFLRLIFSIAQLVDVFI